MDIVDREMLKGLMCAAFMAGAGYGHQAGLDDARAAIEGEVENGNDRAHSTSQILIGEARGAVEKLLQLAGL